MEFHDHAESADNRVAIEVDQFAAGYENISTGTASAGNGGRVIVNEHIKGNGRGIPVAIGCGAGDRGVIQREETSGGWSTSRDACSIYNIKCGWGSVENFGAVLVCRDHIDIRHRRDDRRLRVLNRHVEGAACCITVCVGGRAIDCSCRDRESAARWRDTSYSDHAVNYV